MSVWSAMADQARLDNPEVIQEAWQKHLGKMNQPLPDVDGQPAQKEKPLARLLRGTESLLTSGNPELVQKGQAMLSQYHSTANRPKASNVETQIHQHLTNIGLKRGTPEYNIAYREQIAKSAGSRSPTADYFEFARKMGLDPKARSTVDKWRRVKGVTESSAIQLHDLIGKKVEDPANNPKEVMDVKDQAGVLTRDLKETATGYNYSGDPDTELMSKNKEAGIWQDVYGGDVAEFLINARGDFSNTEYQIQAMDRTRSDLDRAIEETTGFTTGIPGLLSIIPGTPQKDLANIIGGIKSRVGIQTIKDMKDASKNGSTGFGAISAPELDILLSYFGRLDQETTKEQLIENLQLIDGEMKKLQKKIRKGRKAGYKRYQRLSQDPTYAGDLNPDFLEQNKGVLDPHVKTWVDPKTGTTYEMTEEM